MEIKRYPRWAGVDYATGKDKSVVTMISRKDDGTLVIEYSRPALKLADWGIVRCNCKDAERNPIDAVICGWCGKPM